MLNMCWLLSLFLYAHSFEGEGCGCNLKRSGDKTEISTGENVQDFCDIDRKTDHITAYAIDDYSKIRNADNLLPSRLNMSYITGGKFTMGTDKPIIFPDGESPARKVYLSSFYLDKYEVSNEEFKLFVDSTGYITDSELYGWSFVFHSAIPSETKASIQQAVLGAEWWLPVNGSSWLEPEGPGSNVFSTSRHRHPVVHISWTDAAKYCYWRNARLPTEAEWEFAARGGKDGLLFPWGNNVTSPRGTHRANIYHGKFPGKNTGDDGFEFLAPVDAYIPQNDFGLYNMIGNAWEWVGDWWTVSHITTSNSKKARAVKNNPKGQQVIITHSLNKTQSIKLTQYHPLIHSPTPHPLTLFIHPHLN